MTNQNDNPEISTVSLTVENDTGEISTDRLAVEIRDKEISTDRLSVENQPENVDVPHTIEHHQEIPNLAYPQIEPEQIKLLVAFDEVTGEPVMYGGGSHNN